MTRTTINPASQAIDSAAVADRLTDRLMVPPPTGSPAIGWGQSLAHGAAGIALLHIERALTGRGDWASVNTWLAAAVRDPVDASDQAGLFCGSPALAFALHATAGATDRYDRITSTVDRAVTALVHRRVDAGLARIRRREPTRFAEYDTIGGLTGIGAHLLRHAPGGDALGRILDYLVRLSEPITLNGEVLPGWWVAHNPDLTTAGPGSGHANLGMAHGIAGPLALLALAYRAAIRVDGHIGAIERITAHLDDWRRDHPRGPWWPQWITRHELRTGGCAQTAPGRPSWCYGTPGICRALQLASEAAADPARQRLARLALAGCLADPLQQGMVTDPGLCHGSAGLYHTVWRAAGARTQTGFTVPVAHALPGEHGGAALAPGLLDGSAGVALAVHTAASGRPPASGWDACLLIA